MLSKISFIFAFSFLTVNGAFAVCPLTTTDLSGSGCVAWKSQIDSMGSASGVSTTNPIACPNISGPNPTCYVTYYCNDTVGQVDYCRRQDRAGSATVTSNPSDPANKVICGAGFKLVSQAGKDKCVKIKVIDTAIKHSTK